MSTTCRTLRLRTIRLTDLPHFLDWWQDPEIRTLTSGSPKVPTERWIARRVVEMINPSQDIHRIILANGKPIGHCSLIRQRGNQYETQIAIGEPRWWNKGLGTRAIRILLNIGASKGLYDIKLEVRPSNTRAIRAYEKCGFRRSGYRYYPQNPYLPKTLVMRRTKRY